MNSASAIAIFGPTCIAASTATPVQVRDFSITVLKFFKISNNILNFQVQYTDSLISTPVTATVSATFDKNGNNTNSPWIITGYLVTSSDTYNLYLVQGQKPQIDLCGACLENCGGDSSESSAEVVSVAFAFLVLLVVAI